MQQFAVLDRSQCVRIRDSIYDLQSQWIRRDLYRPFYTLAVASYMDAVGSSTHYMQRAQYTNPVLREHFGWLYERIACELEKYLNGPVVYEERFALPGFHIFQYSDSARNERASLHFDLQYQQLPWEFPLDAIYPISFTLSISIPLTGAGLWTWNVDYSEISGKPRSEFHRLLGSREKTYQSYVNGSIVVHSGHTLHEIAAMPQMHETEERITFQGHGLLHSGVWHLYW